MCNLFIKKSQNNTGLSSHRYDSVVKLLLFTAAIIIIMIQDSNIDLWL